MGFYVDPPNETKEAFLKREGMVVPKADWDKVPKDMAIVVLVDNGAFRAAGIAFSEKEYHVFTDHNPRDPRPRTIYLVKKQALKDVGCNWPGMDN